tara:strand:- start:3196 stop:4134 length:939 start_codon:yes stop_codon:yes gene_type:complete
VVVSYIGNGPPLLAQYGVESFNGGGTSFTLSKPATTATVLVFIDGVRQTPTDAYSVSGVTLTTTATTPSGTDNVTVQFLGDVVDFGEPSDDSVSTAKIQDDAVTAAKLANSINTEITANTAKVTNATHTGDVTGATALTIATDAVDIAMLSATGTASATTFLRGDNAWAAAGGGTENSPYFFAKTTGDSTWGSGSYTQVVLNSVVAESNAGSFNTTNYEFTVPTGEGGTYLIGMHLFAPSQIAGLYMKIQLNGSDTTASPSSWYMSTSNSANRRVSPNFLMTLAAGDVIDWFLYGTSGTTNGGNWVWGWRVW